MSEIVLLLLALSGFGVQQNPNAPGSAEVLKYAPADADLMVYLDAEAVLPGNWKFLTGLATDPALEGADELRRNIQSGIALAEGGRTTVKSMLGFDPIHDVKSAAVFLTVKAKGDPDVLIVVRGNFPADVAEKVGAQLGGKAEKADRPFVLLDAGMALSSGADGSLLFGTAATVKARAAKAWKPQKGKKGSLVARAPALLDQKPFFAFASNPSPTVVKLVAAEAKDEPEAAFLFDLILGHEFASIAMFHNGLAWSYRARTAAGYDRAVMASEGFVQLIRSSHLFTRGFAGVMLAAIESYAAEDPMVAEIAKHKAKLLALVEQWTGDGNFAAKVDKQQKERTVTVTATGAKLTDVLPLGGLLPAGAAGFLMLSTGGGTHTSTTPSGATASPF
jgi:hypothetical protein